MLIEPPAPASGLEAVEVKLTGEPGVVTVAEGVTLTVGGSSTVTVCIAVPVWPSSLVTVSVTV